MLLENFTYPQDTRVRNEAETLAAAGYRVTVIAPRGSWQPARERVRGVAVRRYRTVWASSSLSSYLLEYAVAHAQLLVRSLAALFAGARVLHFHGPPDTLALAGALARLLGGRVVYDMHDSAPELFEAKFGTTQALVVLRAAQNAAVRAAHLVIVTNESQRSALVSRPAMHQPRVTIVRNGPRAAEFPEPPRARAGTLGAPKLVYVGTLDVQDGVLDLPDLLRQPVLAEARLTVVGDGPARGALRARCEREGVADRVTFSGRVPHGRVAGLVAEADIGIDPAPGTKLNHGSTMIKVAEYMAAGRPVVAYDLRETRRTAGAAALYAPCGEPAAFASLIELLARDGERRLELGRRARERALGLTWERSAQALLGAYHSLYARRADELDRLVPAGPVRSSRRRSRRSELKADGLRSR